MGVDQRRNPCLVGILFCFFGVVYSVTGPGDFKILNDFRNGLENPELLKWPDNGGDPCGSPSWPHVFCSNGKVTQIQVQGMGLKGPLPQNLNQLDKLQNVGLQKNNFNGKLPSFSGLSELQFAYLDFNQFDVIPSDFFHGLGSIRVLALDSNPFNASTGWSIPSELQESTQLTNFSCSGCNIVGPLPDFFGKFPSLSSLRLSYNRLSGEIPSGFLDSMLQVLWLNDQDGDGMTGSIDVIATMTGLTQAWLHGNSFSGSIPDNIGALTSLRELNLNGNQLVGLIPKSLATMSSLQLLDLNNNMLMGPIPKFKASNVTYSSNLFCQPDPGTQCSPEVNALLDFLGALNYPTILSCKWSGNDPCGELWWGINCNSQAQVSVINLQKLKLNGTLSPSLAVLDSLLEIHLGGNHLNGPIPANLTQLKSLRLLDLSGNNFHPPLPKFHDVVRVIVDGNPLLIANQTKESPSPTISPVLSSPSPFLPSTGPQPPSNNSGNVEAPPSNKQHSPSKGSSSRSPLPIREQSESENHQKFDVVVMVAIVAASTVVVIFLSIYCLKKRKVLDGLMVHPKDTSPSDSPGKVVISDNSNGGTQMENGSEIIYNGRLKTQTLEASNLVSIDVLREVTDNFASENLLGRGGFGAVYKGELDDGTKIAVKRMESGVISNKALEEFQAEIAVLSKVQHRHLVSLLGYTIDGNERLLIYEYMPQGALSRHLFHWKSLGLEPLSWMRRLTIALDIARGIEYLHSLAHQSFIHRDLKSSNILLDDSFRAKISDFGLVKLAPDRERSIVTRLAGTFGYLAPEYAVTGKITTKVDVFSFGVVLMELLTGLVALDEQRSEESRYLAEWFWQIKSSRKSLIAAIDPTLDAKEEEAFDSICVIAELAGHCTERDPNHRPDMGHVVNVVSPLVEKWKPFEETEEYRDIDYALPLSQMLKGWQEEETKGFTGSSLKDSKGSIPAKPAGFADSFTSADAR